MMKLYYAPRTRAMRILWLLEELQLPYELERGEFDPTTDRFFIQKTPTGKYPTLVDGEVTLCESGAIVEWVLERHGEGRLAPPVGTPERAAYLQWLHYAEGTAFPPVGIVVWLSRYRNEGEAQAVLLEDARARAAASLDYVEQAIGAGPYLLGDDFSAADCMMGFTVFAAQSAGVLDERFPNLAAYLARLASRPALQKVLADL